jgi:HEAT repeat protein
VRLNIMRALGRLQSTHPDIGLDDALLEEQLRGSLQRVVQLLEWSAAIENEENDTPDRELLRVALHDKENATMERAFSLMGLRHPEENFALVWRGLRSDNSRLQAASVEVLEAVLAGPVREAVLAIVDEGEPTLRRAQVAAAALGTAVHPLSHRAAIDAMSVDRSEVVRSIAAHHLAELGPPDAPKEMRTLA